MRPWTRWLMLTALPLLGACTSFADADLGTTSAGGQAGSAGSGGSVGGSSGQSGAAGSAQGGSSGQGGASGASGQSGAGGSTAGQSGAGGSAGAAGSGGQGGSAGKGGDTGVGGAAGVGGAGAGGSGGASGDAGTSGSGGGGAGGSAGAGGSDAGGAGGSPGGAGGSAGAGGSNVGGFSGSSGQGGAGGAEPGCGDGACSGGETSCTCPNDCGAPDCGECGDSCGDGVCNCGEDSSSCPADCAAVCGNGKCEVTENACKCAVDCGQPQCGECGSPCGNGVCDCGESNASCPSDCPGVCGNGKIEAGEECDGFITVDCDGFLKNGGFGGSPVCGNDCKVDLSACEYCGNGQLDPSETCDGSVSMSCSTLGAGNGNLSCKGCQLDTSGCSLLSCGYRTGLSLEGWPLEGGCTRRPNQSNSTGPISTTPYLQFPAGGGSSFSPQLVTAGGESFFQGINGVFRLNNNGLTQLSGFLNQSSQSLAVMANGNFFRVSDNAVANFEVNNNNNQANIKSSYMLSGQPTLAPVLFENSVAYFGKEGGRLYRLSQMGSPNNVYTAPSELGGTMAYDNKMSHIYFASTCTETDCQVYARPIATNAVIAWTASIGGPSTDGIVPGCHVAIGADSTVYTTCGSSMRRINPSNPQAYIDGFNLSFETRISPPTLAADGIIYVATRQVSASQTGTLMALSPQLKTLWTRNLEGAPLGAPLLDRDGNLYLCQSQSINSYGPDGTPRWSYVFDNAQACAISLDQGVLDVVTSKEAFRFK